MLCKTSKACQRRCSGNVLILTLAIILVVVLPIGIFALSYSRLIGSHHEQVSAIEAAALSAAQDLSRIVVEDPDIGFISIGDYGPSGKDTKAMDNYFLPVHGVNTLTATCRLDMILADLLDDETLRRMAQRDYNQVQSARLRLETALRAAILPGGKGKDLDGKDIEPLKNAEAAYNANQIRMNGGNSRLVAGSMKLTLGCVDGLTTMTPIPAPSQYANLVPNQQDGGFYKAYVNVPYGGQNFVFCAAARSATLVETKEFVENLGSLPYFLPTVVRCDAEQEVDYVGTETRKATTRLAASACAQPGVLNDRRPFPGSLLLSFPDGAVPELTTLLSVFNHPNVAKSPTDRSKTSLDGDSPPEALSGFALPVVNSEHPPVGHLLRIALYDWLRRVGPNLNVQSVFDAFKQPLSSDASAHADALSADANGIVSHRSFAIDSGVSLPVSQNQWYAASGQLIESKNGFKYDCFIRDYVFQPGRSKGGGHGGEPLALVPPSGVVSTVKPVGINEDLSHAQKFPTGPADGAARPTYSSECIAAEIRFRKQ